MTVMSSDDSDGRISLGLYKVGVDVEIQHLNIIVDLNMARRSHDRAAVPLESNFLLPFIEGHTELLDARSNFELHARSSGGDDDGTGFGEHRDDVYVVILLSTTHGNTYAVVGRDSILGVGTVIIVQFVFLQNKKKKVNDRKEFNSSYYHNYAKTPSNELTDSL